MTPLSTSALAKKRGTQAKALFDELTQAGFVIRENDAWVLTNAGSQAGGEYKESPKYGRYIVWPEDVEIKPAGKLLTASKLGEALNISARTLNQLLDELGWINKAVKGWKVTDAGKRVGGVQKEDNRSGIPYVAWNESILSSKALTDSVKQFLGVEAEATSTDNSISSFRQKFEAKHRSTDGHYVRSKAEMLIDNWLYMAGLVHAYERKLPVEEDVYCDFYLPAGKIYIEFWGLENDPKYADRKKIKQDIYKKYNFNLIELNDDDVQNLDDILPRLLLKFDVTAY
ncbi:glycerol kinase [Thaumasiovibrio subtropicus]|uniref:glycerol kinase n=1 Tax=Thaumasiovibrio subtropicus TaxID=1891207 RepID=UPI000B3538C6|nr:glycerol kinase [Thaumasiovibrio subtropicus]